MDLLVVDRVVKNFGGLRVLNQASLVVKKGTVTALVGPNGSGKTTLFNVIYGLTPADEGEVYFRGKKITRYPPYQIYREGLALAFQLPRLFNQLPIMDNLLLAAPVNSGENPLRALFTRPRWQEEERALARQAREVLELLELTPLALRPAGQLSGGQRKLVEIGRVLMAKPEMILVDEPAAGINPVLARKIYATLKKLQQEKGLTLFVIEHRLEVLFDFADYVYLMDAGRVVLEGTPEEVLAHPDFYTIYAGESRPWRVL
ncbi:ABC transporter ATP-binding protein [Ammonifex thiophilus]|uniref:ABC transporter ATP-binding protein n=1 Tax=Ammonifex thiophilus TaxID=444093 RepID=A0A3D8P5U6_9THEO|nr:ABC transporter ATP-binding protein [Ammonifex thiophilus]RDV83396.1 ABC transporter ATP-binding protein [Ammonifex thiophilus]